MEPNATRAKRCGKAIARYGDDLPESNLIDLLADAMHWCRCTGTDFQKVLDIAERHYQSEIIEQTGVFP